MSVRRLQAVSKPHAVRSSELGVRSVSLEHSEFPTTMLGGSANLFGGRIPNSALRWVLKRVVVWGLGMVLGLALWPSGADAQIESGGAVQKLGRGAVNIVTGWVEIPKRIYETSQTSGAAAGWTWGLLRGIGRGFVRTAAGFYEAFTFPFPAPANYEPVLQPEYVFLEDAPAP